VNVAKTGRREPLAWPRRDLTALTAVPLVSAIVPGAVAEGQ
jgi:hypothetical protein